MTPTSNPHRRRPQLRGIVIKPGRMADGQQHPAIVAVMPRPQTTSDSANREYWHCGQLILTPESKPACPKCFKELTSTDIPGLDMSNEAMYAGAPDVARDADRKAGIR